MADHLVEGAKFTSVMSNIAAAQSATKSTRVDMQGFESVTFVGQMGTIAGGGVASMSVAQSATDADGARLSGLSVTWSAGNAGEIRTIDVKRPEKRYLQCWLTTATANGAKRGAIAVQYNPRIAPVTQPNPTDYGVTPDEA